jgi:hypothetical protein
MTFCSTGAWAQRVTLVFLEAQNLNDGVAKRIQKVTAGVLKQVTNFEVIERPMLAKSAPKKCDLDCAELAASALKVPLVLVGEVRSFEPKGEKVSISFSLFVDGETEGLKRVDLALETLETGLKGPLDALLPGFMKRGFGALRLVAEEGSVVKIDGRLVTATLGSLVSVPAGAHTVDVLGPTGSAVTQRIEVPEGSRTRIAEAPTLQLGSPGSSGLSALRATSYGVFVAGSAVVASGFIAGTLRNAQLDSIRPCVGASRDCDTLDAKFTKEQLANDYASTGNVLLGVGTGLAAAGIGLFVLDLVLK